MSENLDFDYLCNLLKTDPEAFEAYREREIEKVIQSAPEATQQRLRGLQFQIDAKREVYKDRPYMCCMEISKMMHESFHNLNYKLSEFCGRKAYLDYQPQVVENDREVNNVANVVEFRR